MIAHFNITYAALEQESTHIFKASEISYVLTLIDDLGQVHLTWLEGLGASYRMKGYFMVKYASSREMRVEFEGVAFGGNYGGHNINVQISEEIKMELVKSKNCSESEVEALISEVQRKMLNNEMIVEYEKLKPETSADEPFGNI